MNKKIFLLFSFIFTLHCLVSNAQTVKTVGGAGANYATLKAAFDAINAGTITGVISLQINGNTSESASAVLNATGSGSASYSSITIYPIATGYTISGSLNAPLIDLNGATNVVIDGRVNATGSAKDLTITNTYTGSGATASTLRFINSAASNTVKYCTLKGSETSTTSAVLMFSLASAGSGNSSNVIDNNNITSDAAGRPVNALLSSGTLTHENSSNTISNNCFYDFLNNTVAFASHAISISTNSGAWTLSGNSFYERTSLVPYGDVEYDAIIISTGASYTITDNYIGGSAASCGGSAFTKTNAKNNAFYAIYLNVGTSAASSVQNNTIRNFAWSNSAASDWTAINIQAGFVNIGNVNGNTIGAETGTGSVVVSEGASGATFYGIKIAGPSDCENNKIGAITIGTSDANHAANFYGIIRSSSGTVTISNNTIGSATTANSIQTASASLANAQNITGINNSGGGSYTISNNTIANLTNSSSNTNTATLGSVTGLATSSGSPTLSGNIIHDLTTANANTSSTNTASVCGIAVTGTDAAKTITGNKIYNLSNTYASFSGSLIGLYFLSNTGSNTVASNFIESLSVNAGTSAATVYGIYIASGATTYSNNIINLGGNTATGIYGIYETGAASQSCNLYFNTIYIGGSLGAGASNNSYCV